MKKRHKVKGVKTKNTRFDLIWIIPELIGSVAISIAAVLYLKYIPSHQVISLVKWIFQASLVLVVLGVGFKGLGHACDELENMFVFAPDPRKNLKS